MVNLIKTIGETSKKTKASIALTVLSSALYMNGLRNFDNLPELSEPNYSLEYKIFSEIDNESQNFIEDEQLPAEKRGYFAKIRDLRDELGGLNVVNEDKLKEENYTQKLAIRNNKKNNISRRALLAGSLAALFGLFSFLGCSHASDRLKLWKEYYDSRGLV